MQVYQCAKRWMNKYLCNALAIDWGYLWIGDYSERRRIHNPGTNQLTRSLFAFWMRVKNELSMPVNNLTRIHVCELILNWYTCMPDKIELVPVYPSYARTRTHVCEWRLNCSASMPVKIKLVYMNASLNLARTHVYVLHNSTRTAYEKVCLLNIPSFTMLHLKNTHNKI